MAWIITRWSNGQQLSSGLTNQNSQVGNILLGSLPGVFLTLNKSFCLSCTSAKRCFSSIFVMFFSNHSIHTFRKSSSFIFLSPESRRILYQRPLTCNQSFLFSSPFSYKDPTHRDGSRLPRRGILIGSWSSSKMALISIS